MDPLGAAMRHLPLLRLSLITSAGFTAAALLAAPDSPNMSEAFQASLLLLTEERRKHFEDGKGMMRQIWLAAPAAEPDRDKDGLGPLFNERSCDACHPGNARGRPPERAGERLSSALVRLSVIENGSAVPHPSYGLQFNEQGIPGVPGEGRASVSYTEKSVRLADGEVVRLRKPQVSFRDLNYGAIDGAVLTSLRVSPPVFGMGLLDAVPESSLLELADEGDWDKDGISGRPNRVWSPQLGRPVVGRFGLKASIGDLRTQIATALSEDIGITNPRFPKSRCTSVQRACLAAPSGGEPEITPATNHHLPDFMALLAPPPRRHVEDPATQRGEVLFRSLGCAACHRETLRTGKSPAYLELSEVTFHPYTDLLLHDLGPGLSDGRPDEQATGSEWRTAPLWGIGLAQVFDKGARFLHDGRARTLTEAIVWHDGEARAASEGFRKLKKAERKDLLAFLDSL